MTTRFNRTLLERLLELRAISPEQLDQLERAQKEQGLSLRAAVVRLGCMDDAAFMRQWAQLLGLPIVDLATCAVEPDALALVPRRTCVECLLLPLHCTEDALTVAMAEPTDLLAVDNLRFLTNRTVEMAFAPAAEVRTAIGRYYPEEGPLPEPVDDEEDGAVIQVIDEILEEAVERRASHIHFEPQAQGVRVRVRIDGALHDLRRLPPALTRMAAARVKIKTLLDISERRRPQSGRIQIEIGGRHVTLRASTLPTIDREERIVLHILDPLDAPAGLEASGLEADAVERFKACLAARDGLVLVCGPAQCGRTTTFYHALELLARAGLSVMSAEHAVERRLPEVTQLELQPGIGLGMAEALRALLRQDPDAILLAELTDSDTARHAVRASLEGRLLLSGMHVSTGAAAIMRLQDMGIDAYLIAASLRAVLTQRLVRRLCDVCREPDPVPAELRAQYGLNTPAVFRPRGCPACDTTGYRGRTAVGELLVIDDVLRAAIARPAPPGEIDALARSRGGRSLRQAALAKVAAGITSLAEALAVDGRD